MPSQSHGVSVGEGAEEVKVIGTLAVPTAVNPPSCATRKREPASKYTVVPGRTVR